jgi:hypothetical protein
MEHTSDHLEYQIAHFCDLQAEQQRMQWRDAYETPHQALSLHTYMAAFVVDADQAWQVFQALHPDLAALPGIEYIVRKAIADS